MSADRMGDTTDERAEDLERPVPGPRDNVRFGSDIVADALRALAIPYIALNPGASFRGLHDSLVNHLENREPRMLLCLHEEHAVAIAHGWAKVTGTPMAAAVHSNVGLFHATMAIFNAWCDRIPLLLLGATGPVDATKRRPWIDWIHTARDQGAILRGYVKWDDQPASAAAAAESLMRAAFLSRAAPRGPVYVNLDAEMQEARLADPPTLPDPKRYAPPVATAAPAGLVREALVMLRGGPVVILAGRVSRDPTGWDARVALAEHLDARVVTDLKLGAAFPTDHRLHAGTPAVFPVPATLAALREAEVILSLDWVDLAGTLKAAFPDAPPAVRVIQVSLDHNLHNGWSMDHQGLPPVDLFLAAEPEAVVEALLAEAGVVPGTPPPLPNLEQPPAPSGSGEVTVAALAAGLRHALDVRPVSLLHLPLSWDGGFWPLRHPLDFLGGDGGGGIGGGPGIAVGSALALRDAGSDRLPVAICGDGDFLMGVTAIWTAVHYRIPLLVVVANNTCFFNDEVHQERVARMRGRPIENKWIGQRISDPDVDVAGMARAQGAAGFGPVTALDGLVPAFAEAIAHVEAGGVAVVDVRVATGYSAAMTASLTREAKFGG